MLYYKFDGIRRGARKRRAAAEEILIDIADIMHDDAEYDEQFETECEVPSSNNENNTRKTNDGEDEEDKEDEEEDEDEEIEEQNQEQNELVLRPAKAKKRKITI